MKLGDHVRVLPPHDASMPGVYTIDALRHTNITDNDGVPKFADGALNTATICGDKDVSIEFLEVTDAPVTHPSPNASADGVPETISAAQARAVLLQQGLLDQVTALVDDAGTPQIIKIFWEYEHTLHRNSPALNQMAGALGLSQADIDALFFAAASLRV